MSELEKKLKEEVDRLKEWRDGKHFHLQSFNVPNAECRRCRMTKPHIFVVTVNMPVAWTLADDPPTSAPAPVHENVCRDCLTDSEIAALLLPTLHFVMTVLLRDWQHPSIDTDLLRSLHYVKSYLSVRSDIVMRPYKDQKEFSLRALEGLKGIQLPEINFNQLYSELSNADCVPATIEEARALPEKVNMWFRNGSSIENYALG